MAVCRKYAHNLFIVDTSGNSGDKVCLIEIGFTWGLDFSLRNKESLSNQMIPFVFVHSAGGQSFHP